MADGVLAGAPHLLAWVLGRRLRFRVSGSSMFPTLRAGQHVLVNPRAYRRRSPAPGDIVLARHPFDGGPAIIKRVQTVHGDGLELRGDNTEASTDSLHFGRIREADVMGQVVWRMP